MARHRIPANYIAIASFCIASLLFSSCNKKEETPTPEVIVQAVHPSRGNITEEIAADAVLAPLAQAAISPKVTAPIKKFFVQRGSHVKEGQLLAILENTDLQAAALDNKGSYTAAQATFETATRATAPEDYTRAQLDLA
jgi:HlyD family secretion protein